MSTSLHQYTPTLSAIDPRGLDVNSVAYHRLQTEDQPEARSGHQRYDADGRLIAQWDARLWAEGGEAGAANQAMAYSLSSQVLRRVSTDSGWRIALFDDASQVVESRDERGTRRQIRYDDQLRPVSVYEQMNQGPSRCVERFTYGDASQSATNRCGRVIRHDDMAGSQGLPRSGLLGQPLDQTQWFLAGLETPDWPEENSARDALLEHSEQGATVPYITRWQHDALGTVLGQTDARGNTQHTCYDLAGQPTSSSLKPSNELLPTLLVKDLTYNAFSQVERETVGSGVTTTAIYSAVDSRLLQLHSVLNNKVLQALTYSYDPAGNILSVGDTAQPTDWFNGEQIDPVARYVYDTLYQLVKASGRESVQAAIQPNLPGLVLPGGGDASRRRNYTQTFSYDSAGNLLTLKHGQIPIRTMKVDARSNRSMFQADANNPPDISQGFDGNGNMLRFEGMQEMRWDARNQLQQVIQVARQDSVSDDEVYVYDAGGQRRRKLRVLHAKGAEHVMEVRYLPGLEIRSSTATGEALHVTTVCAGRSQVRHLVWQAKRKAITPQQWRYSLGDHLGSCTLELDEQGEVISQEGYYPYGGTAWWAARNEVDAKYKTIRYSGKERDATGLYYYGFRYYAPWLQRWINPDPAGDVDGLNLYRFVRNNPISNKDTLGLWPDDVKSAYYHMLKNGSIFSSIASERMMDLDDAQDVITRLSEKNHNHLLTAFETSAASPLADRFIERMDASDYSITHFSRTDFRQPDGSVQFLSRHQLQENRIPFNVGNTPQSDITLLSTDRFAFFSLSVEGKEKKRSRFGNARYVANLDALGEHREFSMMQTHDITSSLDRLMSEANSELFNDESEELFNRQLRTRLGESEDEAALASIYIGKDITSAIKYAVAVDLSEFKDPTSDQLLQALNNDTNSVVQLFYRPQLLIPGGIKLLRSNVRFKK